MEEGYYEDAIEDFKALGNFKDSPDRVKQAQDAFDKEKADTYKEAKALLEAGDALGAKYNLTQIEGYKDADELFSVAVQQELVNEVYDNDDSVFTGFGDDCLNNNELQEVLQGAWMLVGDGSLEKLTFSTDGEAIVDDGTVYKWEIIDNEFLFYECVENSTLDSKYRTHYSLVKADNGGYYLGEANATNGFEFDKILLPVGSEYVKRLQAYVANEEE